MALETNHARLAVSGIPEAEKRKGSMEDSGAPGLVTRLFEEGEFAALKINSRNLEDV